MNQENHSRELQEQENKPIGFSLLFTSVFLMVFLMFTSGDAIGLSSDHDSSSDYKFYGWLALAFSTPLIFIAGVVLVIIGSIQSTIIKSHNLQIKTDLT